MDHPLEMDQVQRASSGGRLDSSLLGRFNTFKQGIVEAVGRLVKTLNEVERTLQSPITWVERSADGGPATVHRDHLEPERATVADAAMKAAGILEAVSRDSMKVVFVGRTSTGKSTTINAMLGGRILPSGVGHTTNCFCRVHGIDSGEPYLTSNGGTEQKPIADVKQLAHALFADDAGVELDQQFVDVHWPRGRCPLL
jgi:mitofusin